MRTGVRARLLGSYGLILALLALIGFFGLYQLDQAMRALHGVADEQAVGLATALSVRPEVLTSLQADYMQHAAQLWNDTLSRLQPDGSTGMPARRSTVSARCVPYETPNKLICA